MTGRGWTETHPYGGGLLPPQFTDYANNADRQIPCFAGTRAHPYDARSYVLGFAVGRAKISLTPAAPTFTPIRFATERLTQKQITIY